MEIDEVIHWVRTNVEPTPDLCERNAFRCSAYFKDGLYLPCVLVREANAQVRLAIERFEESRTSGITDPLNLKPGFYPSVVRSFIASGNRVDIWDIERVESSPFAIPADRMAEIKGETSMSWTAFAGVMDDGNEFSFGATWSRDFFNMPSGYTADRIKKIIPHRNETQPVYREKPCFECLVEDIDFGAWRHAV